MDDEEYEPDLVEDYLDEDPSILPEERLQQIAKAYGVSTEKVKTIAKSMTKARRAMAEQEQE